MAFATFSPRKPAFSAATAKTKFQRNPNAMQIPNAMRALQGQLPTMQTTAPRKPLMGRPKFSPNLNNRLGDFRK